jgi:uncharacterized protein YndB with AHSA1/START domain
MNQENRPQDAVVIERTFAAPVDLVWTMWTVPEHFAAWYGPPGAAIPIAKMDVRVGGSRLIGMEVQTPDGPRQMWLAGEFLEVVVHERLVYTEWISDEAGTPAPSGGTGDHPGTTEVRVELQEVEGRTRMVMTHLGVPAGSPGALGWHAAFDKLTTLVTSEAGPEQAAGEG